MAERWKPVVGYEGFYEVSDQGRIRSLDRHVEMPPSRRHQEPWVMVKRGRVLKPAPQASGHLTVVLCRDARTKTRSVHTIVCEAFHGVKPDQTECRHLNGNPADNRAINLSWGTRSQNMRDKHDHGTDHNANKTHCPRGHEYTPENTRIIKSTGSRRCLKCHAIRSNRVYHETKQLKGPRPKKTHCVNGHLLEGNQYESNGGCKTCTRARARARKARHAAISEQT